MLVSGGECGSSGDGKSGARPLPALPPGWYKGVALARPEEPADIVTLAQPIAVPAAWAGRATVTPSRQHSGLTLERWLRFSRDQQILMIANEMNRARQLLAPEDVELRGQSYERVLRLVDLTVAAQSKPTFRRELLRWRDLVAEMYITSETDRAGFDEAFLCLLRFTRDAAKQIPELFPGR